MCVCEFTHTLILRAKTCLRGGGLLRLEFGSGSGVSWGGWSTVRVLGNGYIHKSPLRDRNT